MISGPDDDRDLMIGEHAQLRLGHRDERHRQRTGAPRGAERTEHVRRSPAGAESDNGIVRPDLEAEDLRLARRGVILCVLLCDGSARGAPRDQRHHTAGRHGEGRLAFGGIDQCEAPRRACARIDEPTAAQEPRRDRVDRRHDLALRTRDRLRHGRVLRLINATRSPVGAKVEIGRVGVPRLGDEPVERRVTICRLLRHSGQCTHDVV